MHEGVGGFWEYFGNMSPRGRQRQAGRHADRFPATGKQSFTDRITLVPLVPLLTCLNTLAFSRFVVHLYLTGHRVGICAWSAASIEIP